MKKLLLILLCLPMIGFGQSWTIKDYSQQEKKKITPYDTTYFFPNYKISNDDVMRGLIGHHFTFLDVPNSLYLMKGGKGKSLYGSDEDKFKYKSMKVISVYERDFTLECEGETLMYEPSSSDKFIIEEGYKKFISQQLGKKFYSLQKGKITPFNGDDFEINRDIILEIINVEVGKVSSYSHELIYTLSFNGNEFKMTKKPEDFYISQKYYLNSDKMLEFTFNSYDKLKLMTEEIYSKLSKSKFKSEIYENKIVVGMNEFEVRLSWGMPTRNRVMSGYDNVLIYEASVSTTMICFKGDEVVNIIQ